jgi:hypothetical protein
VKARPVYFACALAIAFLIGKASGIAAPPAHRLSGHPSSLAGKLALAKRQVQHDRSPGSHHWLGRDRVYVNQLATTDRAAITGLVGESTFWCVIGTRAPGTVRLATAATAGRCR